MNGSIESVLIDIIDEIVKFEVAHSQSWYLPGYMGAEDAEDLLEWISGQVQGLLSAADGEQADHGLGKVEHELLEKMYLAAKEREGRFREAFFEELYRADRLEKEVNQLLMLWRKAEDRLEAKK